MGNKLRGKDFITVGIFTVIYFVITSAVAMLGVIPIFVPLTAVLVPLVGGIPMMLYFSKVKKFGMVTLMSGLIGVLMLLTGMGYFSIFTGLLAGLLADLTLKNSGYHKNYVLAHGIFSLWVVGPFIPIVIARDSYAEMMLQYSTPEYVEQLMSYIPNWFLPVSAVVGFACGILGALIGRAVFKKHFQRAGVV